MKYRQESYQVWSWSISDDRMCCTCTTTLSFRSKSPDVLFEAIKECEDIENKCPLNDQTISAILKSPLNIS